MKFIQIDKEGREENTTLFIPISNIRYIEESYSPVHLRIVYDNGKSISGYPDSDDYNSSKLNDFLGDETHVFTVFLSYKHYSPMEN